MLSFWLAYILTRPLGANIGDLMGTPTSEKGLGLGTALTSVIFLGAILATVIYLTISKADVIEEHLKVDQAARVGNKPRENSLLAVFGLIAMATALLLHHTSQQPHVSSLADEEGSSSSSVQLSTAQATKNFPPGDLANLKTITQDTLTQLQSGDQSGATTKVTDLENAWDADLNKLKPLDGTAWTFYDNEIDDVLSSLRDPNPDVTTETDALNAFITSLG